MKVNSVSEWQQVEKTVYKDNKPTNEKEIVLERTISFHDGVKSWDYNESQKFAKFDPANVLKVEEGAICVLTPDTIEVTRKQLKSGGFAQVNAIRFPEIRNDISIQALEVGASAASPRRADLKAS